MGVDSGPSISEHVHPDLGESARQVLYINRSIKNN